MPNKRHKFAIPFTVKRALQKLGSDIRDARRRRRIPVSLMAERASVSRVTLSRVEKGEPGVALGTYAMILFVLGMLERFSELADIRNDAIGLELEDEYLPKRIRRSKKDESKI